MIFWKPKGLFFRIRSFMFRCLDGLSQPIVFQKFYQMFVRFYRENNKLSLIQQNAPNTSIERRSTSTMWEWVKKRLGWTVRSSAMLGDVVGWRSVTVTEWSSIYIDRNLREIVVMIFQHYRSIVSARNLVRICRYDPSYHYNTTLRLYIIIFGIMNSPGLKAGAIHDNTDTQLKS